MLTAVELGEDMRAKVEELAARRQQDVDALVREAVSQFVEREQSHAAFRQAALDAWTDFQASGEHATVAEVDEWLAKLELGEDAPPPACHA